MTASKDTKAGSRSTGAFLHQRAVSKGGSITQQQADKAVRLYLSESTKP